MSRSRLASLLPGLLAALLLVGCGRSALEEGDAFGVERIALEAPEAASAYVPTLDGPLRLLSVSPQGALGSMPDGLTVTATFSRPMVPLGDAPPPPEDALTIEPRRAGTLRWEGSQTLVWTPEAPLPPASRFQATVAAGLTALDGTPLETPTTWTFETPRPALQSSEPSYGASFVDPEQAVVLHFNQAVDAGAARSFVTWRMPEADRSVPFTLRNDGDSTLVLQSRAPLERGTAYEVTLRPGLPGLFGALGLGGTVTLPFRTYGAPDLVEVTQPRPWWADPQPTLDPERGVTLVFATPVRFETLRRALRITPETPLPPGIEAQDDVVGTEHTLPMTWQPETRYTVAVDSLVDTFGQVLAHNEATFRTSAYAPSFAMPSGLMVVEADQQAVLPTRATNVPRVRIGAERLTADEIVPLARVYDDQHYYGDPAESADDGMDDRTVEDAPEREPVAATRTVELGQPRNTPGTVPLRLDTLLAGGTGVVGVQVVVPQQAGWRSARTYTGLVQVTRLGLTAKFSPHQNLVLVTDLNTAVPVAGAAVEVRDAMGRVRWEGTTDASGRAETPGWSRLGIEQPNDWSPPVQYVIVRRGDDLAFTTSLYDDGLEPYRFDVAYGWRPEVASYAGSVFTDRGLYRTGETVHLKAILRRRTDGDWQALRDSVRLLIHSPRDEVVLDRRLRASDLGTLHLDWAVPSSGAQGVYTARLVDPADAGATDFNPYYSEGDYARGTFRVEAFRTSTFAVEARTPRTSYVAGDFFEGAIEGRYLFGAAMQDAPVTYALRTEPGGYTPPGFDAYRFGPVTDYDGALYRELARTDTVLRTDGTVALRTVLPGNDLGAPASLIWQGTVTDPARQALTERTSVPLHPGLFYIGLKPRTTFLDLSEDGRMPVDVVTVDPNGVPVAAEDVEVTLVRQQWNSVREVGADGRLRWRSERTEEVAGRQRISTRRGEAVRLSMPVEQGGSYVIRAVGRDLRGNTIRSEAPFYATGSGYVAWQRRDDDRIEVVPEQTTYRPGETARLMVQSPYEEATALVTVEREGILSSRVLTLVGSAPQIEVPLTEDHLPNAFVSVILLHGRTAAPGDGSDVGAPAFKMGYATLRVDPGVRRLAVDVTPDRTTYRPGDEVTVDLRLRDAAGQGVPGEIAFSAADAGVLNLIDYRLPDPFEAFYGPRPLRVTTAEHRAHLVEQRSFGQKEEDRGGGGGDAGALLRQDFRPLAHWAPAVRTDERGRAQVTFRLPESLTTFRLMAAALTGQHQFGAAQTDVVVTQPLVLQPALPRFTRRGDAFEAGVLVTNTTGADGDVTITASAEGLATSGPATRTVRVPDGATKEVRFAWRADTPGEARLTFEAALADERDAFTLTLPVALPTTKAASATFASTDSTAREALRVPADRLPGLGRFEARLASTALVGLDGAARYLFAYPYGCLEQQTSRVRPLLTAAPLLDAFDLDPLGGDRRSVVQDWLDALPSFWTGDGFALWSGGRQANWYVTAYTLLTLAEARDGGFALDASLLADALGALERRLRNRSDRPAYYSEAVWLDTRALMLYALARHGRLLEDEAVTLTEAVVARPGAVSTEGESWVLRLIALADRPALNRHRAPLVDRLRSRVRVEATTAYLAAPADDAYGWIFASDTRATAHGLTALLAAAPAEDTRLLAERMVRYLMRTREGGHWASTQDNAAVLDAFRAYADAYETEAPAFTATVRLAGEAVLDAAFQGRSLAVQHATVPTDRLPAGETAPVTVTKEGTGRTYYSLLLETYTDAPQEALAQGLRVERQLRRLDDTGRPTGPVLPDTARVAAGTLVQVTLRLATPTARHYAVVDDALPAGLEALNPALDTTNPDLAAQTGSDRWWGSFNHTEFKDDRVLLFADYLEAGEHTYAYIARATTPGTFVHPPAEAELMYQPETRGRTATGRFVVEVPQDVAGQR